MDLKIIVTIVIPLILLCAILAMGYVKAPPDFAFIISGLSKSGRVLIGRAGLKIQRWQHRAGSTPASGTTK